MTKQFNNKDAVLGLLTIYMLTKMLWDKAIPNILEILSILVLVYGLMKYVLQKHNSKDIALFLLFVLFSTYVLFDALIKDTNQQLSRAMYEYVFYISMMFSSQYYISRTNIDLLVSCINKLGIVIVALSWYEYLTKSYLIGAFSNTIIYANRSAFRAAVFSRSYLSHGIILGFFTLIAYYVFLKEKKRYNFFQTIITYITILTTSSRGPLVATGFALLIMFIINQYRVSKKIDRKIATWICIVLILLIAFLFLTSTFTTGNETVDYFLYRLRKIIDWSGDAGNLGRIKFWNISMNWFREDRLFGIGPSKTGSWGSGSLGVTESGVLKRLCELGIVGFSMFYLLIFIAVKQGISAYKKNSSHRKLIYILFFGIIGMIMINDITVQSTEEIMVSYILMFALGGMNSKLCVAE